MAQPNKPKIKVKAIHALRWLHGAICTVKCYDDLEQQRSCYDKMLAIIAGHEEFLLTHKMFIDVMRKKHQICKISDAVFYKKEYDFWGKK